MSLMKILSFLRASSRTRTCSSKDKCLVLDSSRARFTPSTIPSTPVEGYPFHSALCSQWFLKFSTPRAIPDFVGFLPSRALGLRVSYRPCSPKKPPRRSRDNHGFTHGQINFSAKNIDSIAVRRFTPPRSFRLHLGDKIWGGCKSGAVIKKIVAQKKLHLHCANTWGSWPFL